MEDDRPTETATIPHAIARALDAATHNGAVVTGFVCFIGIMTPEGQEGVISATSQGDMLAAGIAATGLGMLTKQVQ